MVHVLRLLALVALLTLVLGITVFVAFVAVGGPIAVTGPYVLSYAWPLIYPLVALLGALIGVAMALVGRGRLQASMAALVVGAWLGEYLVVASGVLAGELNPANAVVVWGLATAGPLQPVAVLAGAWLGQRVRGGSAAAGTTTR